ncbi:hypothetical protein NQ318_001149 [Aromia moschata]|uniref:DMA domain-containing protein n=1 Tax=Aromia moschata TaxID=1265417 RepID=A0AAV8ZHA3_9CUCU|nr:hypothetical protein NQ318_001149 [Aromia moschata]
MKTEAAPKWRIRAPSDKGKRHLATCGDGAPNKGPAIKELSPLHYPQMILAEFAIRQECGTLRYKYEYLFNIDRRRDPSKRPRINVEDCSLEESDSDQEEIKRSRQSSPLVQPAAPLVPTPSPEPITSPDPDLDVEDDTQGEAPENLSIKREKQPSPDTPPQTQHVTNFIPYHQHFAQFSAQYHPQYSAQRSPIDVLMRVFPGRRRSDVESILQR